MRRTAGSQPKKEDSKVIEAGDLRLDCESRRLFILNKEVNLTAKEFDLLELLVNNPNKVYSRENLLNLVWGYEYPGDVRTVDVHVRRLREKIEKNPSEPKYVHTKWGGGYYYYQNKSGCERMSRFKNVINFFKSLKFRLILFLILFGIVPGIVLKVGIVMTYESKLPMECQVLTDAADLLTM